VVVIDISGCDNVVGVDASCAGVDGGDVIWSSGSEGLCVEVSTCGCSWFPFMVDNDKCQGKRAGDDHS
jgi:hypothetical protein